MGIYLPLLVFASSALAGDPPCSIPYEKLEKSGLFRLIDYLDSPANRNVSDDTDDFLKLGSHEISNSSQGVVLNIGFLSRDQKKFMKLLLQAIQEQSIDEINAGSIVGPKALATTLHLANLEGAIKKGIIFQGEFDPASISRTIQSLKIPKALRDPKVFFDDDFVSDSLGWRAKDEENYLKAIKELGVQKACQEYMGTSDLTKCGKLKFKFRAGHEDEIEWDVVRSSSIENRFL